MVGLLVIGAWLGLGANVRAVASESISKQIAEHISHPRFAGAVWGVQIVDIANGQTLFATNEAKLLKPASVAKLFTGAASLLELGAEYRIRTSVYGRIDKRGRAEGPLVLFGRGDPSLNSRFVQSEVGGLGDLAAQLRAAGLKSAPDGITADTTMFEALPYGGGWTWDDTQYWYGAQVSALNVFDNFAVWRFTAAAALGAPAKAEAIAPAFPFELLNLTTTSASNTVSDLQYTQSHARNGGALLRVWGNVPEGTRAVEERIPAPEPALWAAELLREQLETRGVRTHSKIALRERSPGATAMVPTLPELAFVESPPLRDLLQPTFWISDNLYAQALLLQLSLRDADAGLSEARGVRQIVSAMQRLGVRPEDLALEDGAGLSRACLVAPRALTQLLIAMRKEAAGKNFVDALPVAGRDGRMNARLRDTGGRIRAKSGSIRYVSTLAGYAQNTRGSEYAFVIFLNNYNAPAADAREAVDAIARLLAE